MWFDKMIFIFPLKVVLFFGGRVFTLPSDKFPVEIQGIEAPLLRRSWISAGRFFGF